MNSQPPEWPKIDWDTEIEARDFSTDIPALKTGHTILVCMSNHLVDDDKRRDLLRKTVECVSKRDYVQLLKEFDEMCVVGRMVGRHDDYVLLKQAGGGEVHQFKIEEILAAMTPPEGPLRNQFSEREEAH